jgi:hypothetical protein
MLEELAAADYGTDCEQHLAGIDAQLGPQPLLGFLDWYPGEVLELERWEEPQDERGHLKRLLACTILLRNAGYLEDASSSTTELVRVVESAIALDAMRSPLARRKRGRAQRRDPGDDVVKLALRFVHWIRERHQHAPDFRPFATFGVILLAAHAGEAAASGEELVALCDSVITEEAACREELGSLAPSQQWLTGLSFYEMEERRRARWIDLAWRVLKDSRPDRAPEVRAALLELADRLERR